MLAPFDNNTVATAIPCIPTIAPVPLGPVSTEDSTTTQPASTYAPVVPVAAVTAPAQTPTLIDWNQFHPDGTDGALQSLLQFCGSSLAAEIHFGRTLPGGGLKQFVSSGRLWTREHPPSSLLKSSVIEASLAPQAYLSATPEKHNSGVLDSLRRSSDYQLVVGFGFAHTQCPLEPDSGLLVILPNASGERAEALLKALPQFRRELAYWLQTWLACRHAGTRNKWTTLSTKFRKYRTTMLVGIVAACGIGIFIPAPYWPLRDCVVEPATRQFVASPIDGRVLHSLVRPGDVVKAGQVIGQLDDEHLRWELGSAEAELQAAQKHRDSALANREGGKLRLAQFEQQQIAIKIQSLKAQLGQLELRSPIDGVVLQGEWFRSEGAPVARGDTLFEIAPTDQMTVEVQLTTDDLAEIDVGDLVTVRVDSAFGITWQGKITRIDPRAAVIDEKVCFVADVEVDNNENRLRPGMKGMARISTGSKSIGWLVFHRPYRWLMKNVIW